MSCPPNVSPGDLFSLLGQGEVTVATVREAIAKSASPFDMVRKDWMVAKVLEGRL